MSLFFSLVDKNTKTFSARTTHVDISDYEENEIRFVINEFNWSNYDDVNVKDDYYSVSALSYDNSVKDSGFYELSQSFDSFIKISTEELGTNRLFISKTIIIQERTCSFSWFNSWTIIIS